MNYIIDPCAPLGDVEQRLAAEACQVQDACNLSGVVHSFNQAMIGLWAIARARGEGTGWVTRAYIDKCSQLAGTQFNPDAIYDAHEWCARLMKAPIPLYIGEVPCLTAIAA